MHLFTVLVLYYFPNCIFKLYLLVFWYYWHFVILHLYLTVTSPKLVIKIVLRVQLIKKRPHTISSSYDPPSSG